MSPQLEEELDEEPPDELDEVPPVGPGSELDDVLLEHVPKIPPRIPQLLVVELEVGPGSLFDFVPEGPCVLLLSPLLLLLLHIPRRPPTIPQWLLLLLVDEDPGFPPSDAELVGAGVGVDPPSEEPLDEEVGVGVGVGRHRIPSRQSDEEGDDEEEESDGADVGSDPWLLVVGVGSVEELVLE